MSSPPSFALSPPDVRQGDADRHLEWACLALALSLVWFSWVPAGFYGADAACYARVARELVTRPWAQWAELTQGGADFHEHPPLANWALALAFHVADASAETAWAWARMMMTALVLTTASIARRLADTRSAALCVLTFVSLSNFHEQATNVMLDLPLTLCTTLGILAVVVGAQAARRGARAWWAVAFAVSVAAAWMTKGPPAAALLFVPFYSAWRSGLTWRDAVAWGGLALLLTLAAAAGFDLWRSALGLGSFWRDYFALQVVPSVVEGRHNPETNPLYYASVLAYEYSTFLFAVPVAVIIAVRRRTVSPLLALAAAWCVVVIGGFSLPRQKYSWYLVPMMPAAAWVMGDVLCAVLPPVVDRWLTRAVAAVAVGWAVLAATGPHALAGPRGEIAVISRLVPPRGNDVVVVDCSSIGGWRAGHLFAFYWDARLAGCEEPVPAMGTVYRFNGKALERVRE